MLQKLVWFIHMICAFFIIGLVLLQHGKSADMGLSMGAGASQTIFGSQGSSSFLTKLTTTFALIFAMTSISLSLLVDQHKDIKEISDMLLQQQLETTMLNPETKALITKPEPTPVTNKNSHVDDNKANANKKLNSKAKNGKVNNIDTSKTKDVTE